MGIFASIIFTYPKTSIIIIALAATFFSMLITKMFTNQDRMRELKDKQKACQKMMKDLKGDTAKIGEIQKDMMACSMEMMKMSFKPMLISFIPFLLLFSFLRGTFAATSIAGGWFWYYLIAGLISSFMFRKILNLA